MSKNMITIMKKEFARFFGDKRLVFTTILMPGLLIYVLYSFMGKAMANHFTTEQGYVYEVHTVNIPASMDSLFKQQEIAVSYDSPEEAETVKEEIKEQETDLLVVFPEGFDELVAAVGEGSAEVPEIEIYYNSVSTESSSVYNMVMQIMDQYESALSNKFDINADEGITYDMATNKDTTAQMFSMMLPMLMMVFLFSGCMAIAPESIVGEKERGTIATLLVTPMKRSELAIGKILSLSVIGLLGGLSSFMGTMLSIPQMMGDVSGGELGSMGAGVYSIADYVLLLLVILTTVLVIIGAISALSGLAKSVKEAGTMVTPLMIVVMVIGITSMFGGGAPKKAYLYLIPFYNSVQCMNGIFSFTIIPVNFVVTIVINLVYTVVMVAVLTKIFDNEKIMYN